VAKFIIGHMSYFDNDLKLHEVEGDNETSVLRKFLEGKKYELPDGMSLEDMRQEAFNGDEAVSIPLKISE